MEGGVSVETTLADVEQALRTSVSMINVLMKAKVLYFIRILHL
jgi:hypothetical protein